MKNYIQRIIRLFATSDPDPKLTGEIHRWLLDQEHAGCHSVADRISFGHFSNDQTALCRSSPY